MLKYSICISGDSFTVTSQYFKNINVLKNNKIFFINITIFYPYNYFKFLLTFLYLKNI